MPLGYFFSDALGEVPGWLTGGWIPTPDTAGARKSGSNVGIARGGIAPWTDVARGDVEVAVEFRLTPGVNTYTGLPAILETDAWVSLRNGPDGYISAGVYTHAYAGSLADNAVNATLELEAWNSGGNLRFFEALPLAGTLPLGEWFRVCVYGRGRLARGKLARLATDQWLQADGTWGDAEVYALAYTATGTDGDLSDYVDDAGGVGLWCFPYGWGVVDFRALTIDPTAGISLSAGLASALTVAPAGVPVTASGPPERPRVREPMHAMEAAHRRRGWAESRLLGGLGRAAAADALRRVTARGAGAAALRGSAAGFRGVLRETLTTLQHLEVQLAWRARQH